MPAASQIEESKTAEENETKRRKRCSFVVEILYEN
jgi:hypothetical protein